MRRGESLRIFKKNYRWIICGLLLLGTTKNYVDRQILGVLKVTLQSNFGWTEIDFSNLILAFQGSYAIGMLVVGRLIDRSGTGIGYALAMFFWSVASMAHAACGSLLGFAFARGALGFWEAGVFPASTKSVSEWFPAKERALANGIRTPPHGPVFRLHVQIDQREDKGLINQNISVRPSVNY